MKTTAEKFARYKEMLIEWSARMNLVAPSTLTDIETRHFADSAQLADAVPGDAKIVDLGSGAGFPAVVLAILGRNVTAIESIGKKVDFLNALKTELDLPNLTIYHGRVENYIKFPEKRGKLCQKTQISGKSEKIPGLFCEQFSKNNKLSKTVYTARAFAPLIRILDYTFSTKNRLYLLKGREIETEISVAKKKYKFDYELIPSKTGDGYIVVISYP